MSTWYLVEQIGKGMTKSWVERRYITDSPPKGTNVVQTCEAESYLEAKFRMAWEHMSPVQMALYASRGGKG